jgi:competence protein ComEA
MTFPTKLLCAITLSFAALALPAAPVNINTADAETMAANLSGIGLSKAQAIVAYRKAHGNFASAEELTQVKGIGPKTVSRNRGDILTGSERE